jgi:arylformamidase
MKIYDISLTISSELTVWPGDPTVELKQVTFIPKGDSCNISHVAMSVHTGTHVDSPYHFLNDGKTVETLPLEVLVGPAYVIQVPDAVDRLTAEVLTQANIPVDAERILFKTRNSAFWGRERTFQEGFVAITADGAEWLVKRDLRLIGMDYLSVAPFGEATATHQTLLRRGIVLLEGVNLSEVPAGRYDLYCLPLKLSKSDGAPARAVLIR